MMENQKCLDDMNKEERMDYLYRCLQLMKKRKQLKQEIDAEEQHIQVMNEFNQKISLYDSISSYLVSMKLIKQKPIFYVILCFICFLATLKLLDVNFIYLPIIHEMIDVMLSVALIPVSIIITMVDITQAIKPIDFCIALYQQEGMLAILKILASYISGLIIMFVLVGIVYCVYMLFSSKHNDESEIVEIVKQKKEKLVQELKDVQMTLFHLEKNYTQQYDKGRLLFNERGIQLLMEVEKTNLYSYEEGLRQAYEQNKIYRINEK